MMIFWLLYNKYVPKLQYDVPIYFSYMHAVVDFFLIH